MTNFDKHIFKCYLICNKITNQHKITLLQKIVRKILNIYYTFLLKFLYGAFIPYTANISKSVKFIHSFHGIFISQNARIGEDCQILHHVTIGSNIQKWNSLESPIIKDNVFIGCNVCIIGKSVIGQNSKIGAGTVIVNKDIKKNSVVYTNNLTIKENK